MLADLLDILSRAKGCRFASFVYRNKEDEVSRYLVLLGSDTEEMYRKDVVTLQEMLPSLSGIDVVAAQELLDSLNESLEKGIGNNSGYTLQGVYESIEGVPNLRIHKASGMLNILGRTQNKTTLIPGKPKKIRNSSFKTLAKNAIRNKLRTGHFSQFNIGGTLENDSANTGLIRAALNGEVLELITEQK